MAFKSLFEVANTRTSSLMVLRPPKRSTSRSCNTLSNLACKPSSISDISSSNIVPPWACSNLPGQA